MQDPLTKAFATLWSGNIRELQNLVERAVILGESDTFVVGESWVKGEPSDSSQHKGLSALADREVEPFFLSLTNEHCVVQATRV